MPEGPEVQTIVDDLSPWIGARVKAVEATSLRPWIVSQNFLNIIGKKIVSVSRLGKFIIFDLDTNDKVVVHLSFTGRFSNSPDNFHAFTLLSEDRPPLYFNDKRGLSRWRFMSPSDFANDATLNKHTVDALANEKDAILHRLIDLRNTRLNRELKPLLLDYSFISGIGNIYGSEICFEARIDPRTRFKSLSDDHLKRLAEAISFVVKRAYEAGGSTIEDFASISGKEGHAQYFHRVYGKQICQECGSRITVFSQAGRTTFFCPACQKGPL